MRIFRFVNHYSIDVSLGAMASSQFIGNILSVDLSWVTSILLALSVWVIYTFDHLEDARSIEQEALTQRHRAHQKHFNLLSYLLIIAFSLAACLIFFIPHSTLLWGTVLIFVVGAYFIMLKYLNMSFSYYKELIIAVVYSLGVFLGPLSIYKGQLNISHYFIFTLFALIAFANLLIFSLYEEEEDRKHRFPSLVQVIGRDKAQDLLQVVFIVQFIILTGMFLNNLVFTIPLILGSMAFVLFILSRKSFYFNLNCTYRLLGDAVFIFPALLFL